MKFKWPLILMLASSFVVVSCGSDNDDDDDSIPQREEDTPANVTTLNTYRCYSGDINALVPAYEVRRERADGNTRLQAYDCRGTENCRSIGTLDQATIGEGDEAGSCLNTAGGFGLCVGEDLVYEETSRGELLTVSTTDGEQVFCNGNIPVTL